MISDRGLFNPDEELLSVRVLWEYAVTASPDDRPEVTDEIGQRLERLARWLQSDEAWLPRWPERAS